MNTRLSVSVAAVLAAIGLAGMQSVAAGTSIKGTVKATGLASNADAVVYVQAAPGTFPPPKAADMDQRQMQFIPHVLPVVVGTTVKFLNDDPTQHNVFTPDYDKFNLGTWPQGQSKDHAFDKCAKYPCAYTLLCRIHPEMEGFVVVLQNPYYAVTNAAGQYEIKDVPPGKYTVAVWHSKLKGAPKPVTVEATPVTLDFTLAK